MNKSQARKILGVDASADKDAIKKAYRSLAMEHHPDRGGDEAKFKELQAALDCLEKPEETQSGADFLNEFMKRHTERGSSFTGFTAQPQVQHATVNISDIEAFVGCNKIVNIAGVQDQVKLTIPAGVGPEDCLVTIEHQGMPVRIFANILSDSKINWTVPGRGDATVDLSVSPAKLIKGGWQDVATPFGGGTVTVRIPAGLESGKLLKVKEKGYWRSISSNNRADLFLRIIPKIKKFADYSEDEQQEFRELVDE